ncbi:MAG: hypothetical protein H0W62_13045 [Chitinophagales bacterium]|nr:hypothetical protein [Chitinophagales bacterium]
MLVIIVILTFFACEEKEQPLMPYKCSCEITTLDWEFGGTDTGTDTTIVMASSYADAKKKCAELNYEAGEESKDCVAVP